MYHPTTRVLTVLELLQSRSRLSGAELAERLEVDRRTVRRYVSTLQELGVPVGIILSVWPGTAGEERTDPDSLRRDPVLRPIVERWEASAAEVTPTQHIPWNSQRSSMILNCFARRTIPKAH